MSNKKSRLRSGLLLAMAGAALPATAQEQATLLDKITVIGNPANAVDMPGSAQLVTTEEIREQNYDDVNRVLRKVPGVYVREEDGFGLFPNISLRGVDTTRSAKVTLMEDGVLMAPAPYSSPNAYYSPTVGRMSGLEVLKGSSQIKYGPHITGGVINYLSTPIPLEQTAYLKSTFGSFNEQRTHAYVGNTFETGFGQVGFLVEGYMRQNSGFRTIDKTPDFRDHNDTGFTKQEPMVKLSWEPNSEIYQRLELKWGRSERDANETYLGISDEDFSADPTRRYSATRFDNITSTQEQNYLRYFVGLSEDLDIITTLYQTEFERNWYKLNDIRDVNGSNLSLSAALAGVQNGEGLDCLRGDLACTLRVRANNREYESKGIESTAYYRFGTGSMQHELAFGIRYHEDHERRFQWDDLYAQEANGTISDMTRGEPGGAGDRLQESKALAIYLQDTIEVGDWTVTPGIRYETLDQTDNNYGSDAFGDAELSMIAGGIGASYKVNENWTGFGGVFRGFSPPSPSASVTGNLEEETSTSFELGARYTNQQQALAAEAAIFYTAFEDLIVLDNIGGAGSGVDDNFGEVTSYGLELLAQYDAGLANGWALRNPWYVTLTYTNATQESDASSTNASSIFSYGEKGNKVPYIPELTMSLGTGLEGEKWGVSLSGHYVDETFTSANNVDNLRNGEGDPDARFGKTDSYFIADVTTFYRLSENVRVFGGIQNLADESYIISRQPHGARTGMPLFGYAGLEMKL